MRNLLANLSVALASFLITILSLEGCARIVNLRPNTSVTNTIPPWVSDYQLRHGETWLRPIAQAQGLGRFFELYEWDRYRFYRVRPNLELEMIDFFAEPEVRERTKWRIETNSLGFRDEEFHNTKQPDTFRVLAVGDSSTFGWGVAAADSFVSVAEDELAQRFPDQEIELLNFGTPGHSSFQGLVLLRDVIDEYSPDAILFSFGANDRLPAGVREADLYERRKSWLGAVESVYQRSHAFQTALEWFHQLRGWRGADAIPQSDPEDETVVKNVSLEEYQANLREVATMARKRQIPAVLVSSCVDQTVMRSMARIAERQNAAYVNGYDTMVEAIPGLASGEHLPDKAERLAATYGADHLEPGGSYSWVIMPDGCHPNLLGHHVIGEALADAIAPWIPAGRVAESG